MLFVVLVLAAGLGGIWCFAALFLRGRDVAFLDVLPAPTVVLPAAPPEEQALVRERLATLQRPLRRARWSGRLGRLRSGIDAAFGSLAPTPAAAGIDIRPVVAGAVRGEWVLAPAADPALRLLYLHGGAFIAGSPRSHRAITQALALATGAAVFVPDYRLQPEHGRAATLLDCRQAYRWLLEHGPHGPAAHARLLLAGDSAGGNLALGLAAWSRDRGLPRAAAVVVFAPLTDATLASPSLRRNVASDPFLGPTLGRLLRLPWWLLAWCGWLGTRLPPQHPALSPLRGTLADLPPTLLQAGDGEMLVDDARRYAAAAHAAGSPVTLELWPGALHAFQLFAAVSPQAALALDRAAAFLRDAAGGAP